MVHQRPNSEATAEFDALLATAQNASTSSDQLARLQHNRSRRVREAVAANPNLDTDNLDTAALSFPEAVLQNPILDWLLLEDANWLEGLDPRARHRLLCSPTISATLLWWAARFGDPADQLSVLTNPAAPTDLVAWLISQDTEGHARVAAQHRSQALVIARDPALSRPAPSPLRFESPQRVLFQPASRIGNPNQPNHVDLPSADELAGQELRAISSQNFSSDAVLLLSCATLADWIQPVLASADVETRRMLSKHSDATGSTLQTLAFDDEADVRSRVAQRSTLPTETRQLLTWLGQLPASDGPHSDGLATDAPASGTTDLEHLGSADPAGLGVRGSDVGVGQDQVPQDISAYLQEKFETTEQSLPQRWIAAHPLTPEPVLRTAIASSDWHVREAAAGNPTITLHIAATALLDSDRDVRIALALNPACPTEFLPILLADTNDGVREAAEKRPVQIAADSLEPATATRKLLTKLAKQTPAIRRLLAQLPGQSVSEQRSYAKDEQWEVRLAFASNPDAETSFLALLEKDPDVDVRKSLAAHPNLSAAARSALLHDEQPAVREALATHADEETLNRLGADESVTVRAVVAKHQRANAKVLERLGEDSDASIREHVAAHRNTPLATRARLATSEEPAVKRAILTWASSPQQNASEQARIVGVLLGNNADDAQTWKRLREGDPTLSRAKLHRLAYATDWGTDSFVGPQTSPTALSVLATFNDWRLRQAVAKHPQTLEKTIALLTRDTDYDVRTSVAEHPLLRQRDLKRLASDPHFAVRLAIALRSDTPTAVLDAMIFDDTDHVREAVLANPRLSAEALALHDAVMLGTHVSQRALTKLAKGNSMIRKIIASHPCCSATVRAELAVDDDWRIREAVARNQATETSLLEAMANDADRDVRAAVAAHADTPIETLLSLSGDSDNNVRTAVLANPKLRESQRQAFLASAYRRSLVSSVCTERVAALLSPLCTERHLNRRSTWQSPQWIERFVAASHPLVTDAVLSHLVRDAHRAVATQASSALRNREAARS
jgi:Leucine rich repeat variant